MIGRFNTVDPLGELDRKTNPYAYVFIDPDGMFGDYYNSKGEWLGKDKYGDNKVYLADEVNKNKTGLVVSATNAKELSINHAEFQTISSVLRHEAGTSDATENLWLAHTANNAAKGSGASLYDKLMSGYSSAPSNVKVPLNTSNSSRSNSARAGVLDVLSGGTDPTGGSTFWDGTDFIAWGLSSPYGNSHAKFRQYNNISISSDIYDSYLGGALDKYPNGRVRYSGKYYNIPASVFSDNVTGNGFNYKTGSKKPLGLSATGAFGHTIFWKTIK